MKGFTLVEVLISLLVIGVLCTSLVVIFTAGKNTYDAHMVSSDLQASVRHALESMTRELRQSRFSSVSLATAGQIRFAIPTDIDDASAPLSGAIRYYVDANNLIREHPAGTIRIISPAITRVSFSLPAGSDLLTVELESGKTVRQRNYTFTLTEQIRIRN